MAAANILNFQKVNNVNGWSAAMGQYASSCQMSSKSVERSQRYVDLTVFFFKMAAVRHMGFVGRLLVSIVLPNLVKINAVDFTTENVQYFASLTSKRLFTTQKLGV